MSKKPIRFRIDYNSDDWQNFRTTGVPSLDWDGGIGSTESATILGLNPWRPVLPELFAWKVGTAEPPNIDNPSMTSGRYDERKVGLLWTAWDGDHDSTWRNFDKLANLKGDERKKYIMRSCKRQTGYFVHEDYPWMSTSIDFYAEKGTPALLTGEAMPNGFIVEAKTLAGYYAKQWESEIPEYHIVQVHHQMIVLGIDYCEIAILTDSRNFTIKPIKRDEDLCELIINKTRIFWENVLKAREALRLSEQCAATGRMDEAEKFLGLIDRLEPDVDDDSYAYQEYYSERFKALQNAMKGNDGHLVLARQIDMINAYAKVLDKRKQLLKNKLIRIMHDHAQDTGNQVDIIDFDDIGKVKFLPRKGSVNRTFTANVKGRPEDRYLQSEIDKLNFNPPTDD